MDRNLLVSLQVSKSHRILDEADEMMSLHHWDIAANRYYYACYHMLQALFISRGIPAKSHEGSLTQLGQQFILTGQLDKKYGRFFSRMIQLRQKADYNSVADVSETELNELQPLAKAFICDVEKLSTTD